MSELIQTGLATIDRYFSPNSRSFPYSIRLHSRANEADRRLKLCFESQEPLGSTQSAYLDEILNRPRNSPPLTEEAFKLFCQDVDQLGLAKAVKSLLKTDKGKVGEQDEEDGNDREDHGDGYRGSNDN